MPLRFCLSILICLLLSPAIAAGDAPTPDDAPAADAVIDIDQLMDDGREALRFGDLKEAKRAFRTVLKANNKRPLANFGLGLVFYNEGNFKQAAEYFKRETMIQPRFGPAYLNWGAASAVMNQHPRAVLAFVDAIRRLGSEETYLNNLGKAIYELSRDVDDTKKLTAELRMALETYRELEARLDAQLAAEGMARWGATKITIQQKRDIDDRIMELERLIQNHVFQLQEFTFEVNTNRRRINQIRMSLRDYQRIGRNYGALEAELTRLELRQRDLVDNIRLTRASIDRLEDQKPKPPWNEDYAILRYMPDEDGSFAVVE